MPETTIRDAVPCILYQSRHPVCILLSLSDLHFLKLHAPAVQVDPDKAFAVQMVLEDNVVNSTVSYVQCALLYTNSNGERRIRSTTCSTVDLPV